MAVRGSWPGKEMSEFISDFIYCTIQHEHMLCATNALFLAGGGIKADDGRRLNKLVRKAKSVVGPCHLHCDALWKMGSAHCHQSAQ